MNRPTRLSAGFIKTVSKPGRYGDGRGSYGLSLRVKPRADGSLSKTFVQQMRTADRTMVTVGLGSADLTSLQEAREGAFDNARRLRDGEEIRKSIATPKAPIRAVPTFRKVAEGYYSMKRSAAWKNERTERLIRQRLEKYAANLLDMRVSDITRQDVIDTLLPIQHMNKTPAYVRKYIRAIMDWAILYGWRTDNPSDAAVAAMLSNGKQASVKHYAALPCAEIGAALDKVEQSVGWLHLGLSLRFIALTTCRSNEVRGARWSEVDLDARTWTIPAERMKAGRPFVVPLSSSATNVLHRAAELADDSGLVFPSVNGRVIGGSLISNALVKCGVQGTPHGMRASFRTWAAEAGVERDVAEMCLAHALGTSTELAYKRTDYFLRRVQVMERWGAVVEGREVGGEVVQFTDATQKVS